MEVKVQAFLARFQVNRAVIPGTNRCLPCACPAYAEHHTAATGRRNAEKRRIFTLTGTAAFGRHHHRFARRKRELTGLKIGVRDLASLNIVQYERTFFAILQPEVDGLQGADRLRVGPSTVFNVQCPVDTAIL